MSTKSTLAYGETFHLYREVFDDDHVYLRLDTTHFEAGYDRVMIPIPIHIWETIRHLGGAELDLVDRSDEELLERVEKEVDERTAEYQRVARERPDRAGFFGILGSLVYGTADQPRDEQVRRGMDYFRSDRKRQREIQARIAFLRSAMRGIEASPAGD
jgi:hypothetical protein